MFKSLKLFFQLVIISGLIWTIAAGLIVFTTISFSNKYEMKMTESLKTEIYNTTSKFILSENERLANLLGTNAHWDDFQKKMQERDTPWIEENATTYLITDKSLKVDELYVEDYKTGYYEKRGELPQSIYHEIIKMTDFSKLSGSYKAFLINYNMKTYVVSVTSISDNALDNITGVYIIGRSVRDLFTVDLENTYSSRADFSMVFKNSSGKIIPLMKDPEGKLHTGEMYIADAIHQFFEIKINENYLAKNLEDNVHFLLLISLAFELIGIIGLWLYFYLMGKNVKKSIVAVKNITYNDYTKSVSIDFSKEFKDLGDCINNLSSELKNRDLEIEKNYIEIITVLIKALEEVDKYTKGHSERVSHYAVALAEKTGYSDIETIRISGLLHDVGKITIDSSILNKPGRLTEEEYNAIKEHPSVAYNILSMSEFFAGAKDIVKYHHERNDGKGYPEGLMGEEIPQGSKIIAIADTFDALTSRRSYREKLSVAEALWIMDETSAEQFDEKLYMEFKKIAEEIHQKWSDINESPSFSEIAERKSE